MVDGVVDNIVLQPGMGGVKMPKLWRYLSLVRCDWLFSSTSLFFSLLLFSDQMGGAAQIGLGSEKIKEDGIRAESKNKTKGSVEGTGLETMDWMVGGKNRLWVIAPFEMHCPMQYRKWQEYEAETM